MVNIYLVCNRYRASLTIIIRTDIENSSYFSGRTLACTERPESKAIFVIMVVKIVTEHSDRFFFMENT